MSEDWKELVGKPIEYDEDTEELAKSLVPLWKEFAKLGCFGATSFMNMDPNVPSETICQCAGKDQEKHWQNQRKRFKLLNEIRFKIEQHHGHPVTCTPHYNDIWIHCEKCGWGFGLDGNGAIKESRAYA